MGEAKNIYFTCLKKTTRQKKKKKKEKTMLSQFHLFKTPIRFYNNEKTLLDHYATLNVPWTASKEEIKNAFLEEAKKVHPDKVTHLDEIQRNVAAERFKRLNDAYEILGDAAKRRSYDAQRGLGAASPTTTSGARDPRRQKQFGLITKRKRTLLWVNLSIFVTIMGLAVIKDVTQPINDK